jgi:hypothetical protein
MRACTLKPVDPGFRYFRGLVLRDMGRYEEALAAYDEALRIDPTYAKARWKRVHLVMLLGQFPTGWELYEQRFAHKEGQTLTHHPIDRWEPGVSLAHKTVLVQSEQGFGDSIQFARFIPELVKLGARVIVEAPKSLIALFQRLQGITAVIEQGQTPPAEVELRIPIMSLALAFQTTLDSIPSTKYYLRADPRKVAYWRDRLGPPADFKSQRVLRVGIAWEGGFRAHEPDTWQINNQRNIPLSLVAEHLDCQGIEWVSLQKGDPAESELREKSSTLWKQSRIHNFANELKDFDDTAALITQLDLVITVDTAIAHLAGALGIPTWVLIRFNTCWRWLLHRTDSPWYQSVRLYRQIHPLQWNTPLATIKTDLETLKIEKSQLVHF